jgi:hypothetical protein
MTLKPHRQIVSSARLSLIKKYNRELDQLQLISLQTKGSIEKNTA